MGLKMSVIDIENDLREGREGEVSNIVNRDEKIRGPRMDP